MTNHISASNQEAIAKLVAEHKYDEALEQIRLAESLETGLLHLKITALRNTNRFEEAIKFQELLYKQDTTNVYSILELANGYMSMYNYNNAISYYRKAREIEPKNFYISQRLGDALFNNSQFSEAKQYYIKCRNNHSTQHLNKQLGRIYENINQPDSAIYYYEISLDQNPRDYSVVLRLSNLYRRNEQFKEALATSDRYLKTNDNNLRVLRLNGQLQFITGNYKKALQRYERCLTLGDSGLHVLQYTGMSYYKTDDYDKAIPFLEKAFIEAEKNSNICLVLALAYIYTGRTESAINQFHKLIEIVTPSPTLLATAYQHIGESYTDINQHEMALDIYKQAMISVPGDYRFHYFLADLYDNWFKNTEKALAYYEKILQADTNYEELPPGMNHLLIKYIENRVNQIKKEAFWSAN
ncbi:Tfp pilus assembly protein PilF [Natronoflexus pectinivorans]|uniref:Tfp pilus assembly protein PilF n=1 Tax=Natronoflexus pectinivorans TaxID=682526 RepID=A0A4R2GKY4_9BACT|nr:Tfp pilus assembly protein PilF [Natronoflexus pectinivorans]